MRSQQTDHPVSAVTLFPTAAIASARGFAAAPAVAITSTLAAASTTWPEPAASPVSLGFVCP